MHRFARLVEQLTQPATPAASQRALLTDYLRGIATPDAAWSVYLLAGQTPGLKLSARALRASARNAAALPDWLFDACFDACGDLADTIAQVVPSPQHPNEDGLHEWMTNRLLPWRTLSAPALAAAITPWWPQLAPSTRHLLVKLLSPSWRPPVSQRLLQQALAAHTRLAESVLAQRMPVFIHSTDDDRTAAYQALIDPGLDQEAEAASTYPFASAVDVDAPSPPWLTGTANWSATWRFPGLPAQLVKRHGHTRLWLAGDRLVHDRLANLLSAANALPEGTVLEGLLLPWQPAKNRPGDLARFITSLERPAPPRPPKTAELPRFLVHDVLEHDGVDIRSLPFVQRQQMLEALRLADDGPLVPAPELTAADATALMAWHARSRHHGALGLQLRHRHQRWTDCIEPPPAVYHWPAQPLTVHAVLVYAQSSGPMSDARYSHFSFAVWNRAPRDDDDLDQARRPDAAHAPDALHLVTLAKVSSDEAGTWQEALTHSVRMHFTHRVGPVHTVYPSDVFELQVGQLSCSTRHKSGLLAQAVHVRQHRTDKSLREADNLATVRAMLDGISTG